MYNFIMKYLNKIGITLKLEKGNEYIINGQKESLEKDNKLKESDIIRTYKDSTINFFVDKSSVQLYESSEIKILENRIKNNSIVNRFHLIRGKIFCSVNFSKANSLFEIETNNAIFTVKGTKFTLEIKENSDTILQVQEGVVEVRDYIKINKDINIKSNIEFYDKIKILIKQSEFIKKDEKVIINNEKIIEFNNELNKLISRIYKGKEDINENIINEKIVSFQTKSTKLIKKIEEK